MAFLALLFCPDDKTARTVTQVLSELEFNVESCTEPFAAVKKLMSGHFDALVVDCDNEQNATLLFKSARNSTSNQTSLAVAMVEGQAGVAKAFRIGANLVLTKPINVEQSKGTLRVARGLLRKGDSGKLATAPPAASSASAPAAKPAVPRSVSALPPNPAKPASPAAPAQVTARAPIPPPLMQPPESVAAAQAAASSGLADADDILDIRAAGSPTTSSAPLPAPPAANFPPARPEMRHPLLGAPEGPARGFAGAASAPAPAREVPVHPPAPPSHSTPHKAEDLFERPAEYSRSSPAFEASESVLGSAPSFTFGGGEQSSGASKKVLIGMAAAVLVGAILYVGWSHLQSVMSRPGKPAPATTSTPTSDPESNVHAPPAKPGAAQPVPTTQPAIPPEGASPLPTATANEAESGEEENTPTESPASAKSSTSTTPASKSAAPANLAETPLVVRGGAAPAVNAPPAAPEAPASKVTEIVATGSGGALSNLVGGQTAAQPVLRSVNISQGVSQGLLLKKVQPAYPRTALSMHIEGIVELMATISKTGDITAVKVLTGDKQLTQAASDAVKQWKYKPYLLNGEPLEIQTQVTISFKLPH